MSIINEEKLIIYAVLPNSDKFGNKMVQLSSFVVPAKGDTIVINEDEYIVDKVQYQFDFLGGMSHVTLFCRF